MVRVLLLDTEVFVPAGQSNSMHGTSPEISCGSLPPGLKGDITSFNGQSLNMTTYQTGRWPGRAVSYKHSHRLQWGRPTQTPACSLGVSRGLLERIQNTRLPGRGNSTVQSWEFDEAGVNAFLPTREPHSLASMLQRRMSQANGTLTL